jgi:hypothetical protein
MGYPAFHVHEQLLGELPSILAGEGFRVTIEPISTSDSERGFVMLLRCTSCEGGVVGVSAQRAAQIDPGRIVVLLHPLESQSESPSAQRRLFEQLNTVLRAHTGA